MRVVLLFFLLLFSPLSNRVAAADSEIKDVSHFDNDDWQKVTKDAKYPAPKSRKVEAQKKHSSPWNFARPGWLKYIFYVIILGILVFLLYKLINASLRPYNRKFENKIPFNEDEEELQLDNPQLDEKLSEALSNMDYRRAIRFSYLIAIRDLGILKLIIPARDKTNYEYLAELNSHPSSNLFRDITRAFEKSWYGEIVPAQTEYYSFEEKFVRFRAELNITNQETQP